MATHFMQGPQQAPSGTNVVSIGPAGSTYTSMEQSGRSLLKSYCDDFPNTDKSFIIPPMFDSEYPEVMPEHSRGLTRKEENKYDGVKISQSGEMAEKTVYDMINEILRKKKCKKPFLAFFGVQMDNDNKMNARKYALMAELTKMKFIGIKCTSEFDCIIVVKDLGTIHIEVKRTSNSRNIAAAEAQLNNGTKFVTNLMDAIRGASSNFPTARIIALPCESSNSPTCKTASDSFVAHEDVCQNFAPLWKKVISDLEQKNADTKNEFTEFCNFLMGCYSSIPVSYGSSITCKSNDSCLSLPKHVTKIDEKVQRTELTSEEQKCKTESEKQVPVSNVVRTNPVDIFRSVDGIGLLYLTPDQHNLYYNRPQATVHGHGGTGKTILCLMKMMDLVRSGTTGKILLVAPSPSHLLCYSILLRNKFNVHIVTNVSLSQQTNCDIVIITLDDFFSDPKVSDTSHLSGYHIFMDDLQDYYAENVCDGANLRKVGEFIQESYIKAKNENNIAWFCFDIVQSNNLEVSWNNKIWYFPYIDPSKEAPPKVILKHVLRNTREIISVVDEGRQRVLTHAVNTNNIIQEICHGHLITSARVQCHSLNSSVDQRYRIQFVVERLLAELKSLKGCKYSLPMSHIAILVENDSVLAEYKEEIDQMLSTNFKIISQTIEESINHKDNDRVLLDVAKHVASFESPTVIYIRSEKEEQVYRLISRARTKLTILDVSESPLQFDSIDSIEWHFSTPGFYNVSDVMDALKDDDTDEIEKLILSDPKFLELRTKEGLTPLLRAAQLGCVKTIEICINYGSSQREKDLLGKTAAMLAVRPGHLDAVKYLMMNGASIDDKDNDGNTILDHAVNAQNIECLKWILQNYPDLPKKTSTLLEIANSGNVEKLKTFRDQGIPLEVADSEGNTILHFAYKAEKIECCKWIVQYYPELVYVRNKSNSSILHHIAKDGDIEMLEILRDEGLSLEETDSQGSTILDLAYEAKQIESCKWIVKNHPKLVHTVNNSNITSLYKICSGDIEMLQILCNQGISLEEVDSEGNTILHYAYKAKQNDCIKWIVQNYPRLLAFVNNGNISTLYEIATGGNVEMSEKLRAHSFSLEEGDSQGNNILHYTYKAKQIECCKWIVNNYPELVHVTNNSSSSVLGDIAIDGDFKMLEMLRDEGVSLEETDGQGNTILHYAYKAKKTKCCKWIVKKYPELVYVRNNNSSSVLYHVAKDGDIKMLEMLRDEGVSLEETDSQGNTILHLAYEAKQIESCKWIVKNYPKLVHTINNSNITSLYEMCSDDIEMLQILCNQGISLEEVDSEGNTILHYAYKAKQNDCIKWIAQNYPRLVAFVNNGNISTLYEIATDGIVEMLEKLRAHSFSLEEGDSQGNNILHYAYKAKQIECCKWIVKNYPKLVTVRNKSSSSVLNGIAKDGDIKMLEMLRDEGVSLEEADSQGRTILHHAMHSRKTECFSWILDNCPQLILVENRGNISLLRKMANISITYGSYKSSMLKKLCEHEQVAKKMNNSKRLVHKAALNCNIEELKILTENRIEQNVDEKEKLYVHLHNVFGDPVTIFSNNDVVIMSGLSTSTVCAVDSYVDRRCKVYYEVEIFEQLFIMDNECAIGWTTTDFIHSEALREVGDCKHSYTFIPRTGERRHNSVTSEWGVKIHPFPSRSLQSFSSPTKKSFIIGVAADLENGKLLYSLDGNWKGKMGVAFDGLDEDIVLFPALSARSGSNDGILFVNFGANEFKHSPPDPTFKSVEELMKGTNILHVLARNNKVEHCKYIVDTYPHLLNETSGRGTPLHECASTGALESMKVLLEAGADMTLKNIFGATALDVARNNNRHKCVDELYKRLNIESEEASVSKKRKVDYQS